MRSAVHGVDAVGERVHELVEAVVVLEGGFDDGAAIELLLYVYGLRVDYLSGLVQIGYEAGYAAVEVVGDFVVGPAVGVVVAPEGDLETLVQVGHLLEALAQGVEVVVVLVEHLPIGQEVDDRPGQPAIGLRGPLVLQLVLADAAREALMVNAVGPVGHPRSGIQKER